MARTTSNTKSLQVGANAQQTLDVSIGAVNTNALAITNVNLMTNAGFAIAQIDMALNFINGERARVGALLNRLDSIIANNQTSAESITASRWSRSIKDADFTSKNASLTRSKIINKQHLL